MPARSQNRDKAKAIYLERMGAVKLQDLAAEVGCSYNQLRKWKSADKWADALAEKQPKKKKGGQPGNHNANGNPGGKGGPPRNTKAQTHGAYSKIYMDSLTPAQQAIVQAIPNAAVDGLREELAQLRLREDDITRKLLAYDSAPDGTLYVDSVMDMQVPASKKAGETETKTAMQNIIKASPFKRTMVLQEALNKVQGRIATVLGALRQHDMDMQRMEIERQRLDLMRIRYTGTWDADINDDIEGDSLPSIDLEGDSLPEP